jgi:succinate dehydrogenase hydrophobic anchor subunit
MATRKAYLPGLARAMQAIPGVQSIRFMHSMRGSAQGASRARGFGGLWRNGVHSPLLVVSTTNPHGFGGCGNRVGSVRGIKSFLDNLFRSSGDPFEDRKYSPIQITEAGDKVVFKSNKAAQIKLMTGTALINTVYWTYHLYNCFMYDGVTIAGVDMGGDPRWGYFGFGVTVVIFAATRLYGHSAVRSSYVSADGQRLGFQMHTMFGAPGRRIEALPRNVEFEQDAKVRGGSIRLKVKGVERWVILDYDGDYHDDGVLKRILSKQKIPDYLAGSPELVTYHNAEKQALLANLKAAESDPASPAASAPLPPPPPPTVGAPQGRRPVGNYRMDRGKR